jgi:phage major head subunit gpT-like protein
MAIVTSDFLAALYTSYKAIFVNEFAAALGAVDYKKITTLFPSNTLIESYSWLGTVPAMREWVDERVPKGLLSGDFSITNKHYEASISVDRDTLEDDRYNMIKPRIQQLAQEAARHPDELTFALINAGATGLAYDGTEFFADTRVIGASGNIDNIAAGAYAATSAKIRTGLGVAGALMRLFQDDNARPMNLVGDTILCAPAMEDAILLALLPDVAGTVLPISRKIKEVIVSPFLTSGATAGHDYYLICNNHPLKPFFFQSRKTPEFVSQDNPAGGVAFSRNLFQYGVDARYNVGYGDPRYAVQIDCSD